MLLLNVCMRIQTCIKFGFMEETQGACTLSSPATQMRSLLLMLIFFQQPFVDPLKKPQWEIRIGRV